MRAALPSLDVVTILFLRELAGARRSLASWLLPTAGLVALTASMQPQMSEKGNLIETKLEMMPKAVLAAMNMQTVDLTDPVHFIAMNSATWLLLGALFAALLGASLVSKEEQWRTAEVLLTLPVRREAVVAGKALAGLVLVLAFDAVLAAAAFGTYAGQGVHLEDPARLATIFAGAALVHAALLALAMLASVSIRRARAALPIALGIVFGTWSIGIVAGVADNLVGLRWLSPFKYADPATIAREGAGMPMAVLPVLTLAALVGAVVVWTRKDIHA